MTVSSRQLREVEMDIPASTEGVLSERFLKAALGHLSGDSDILSIKLVDEIKAMASKVRVEVQFANQPDNSYHLCIKGFLDSDQDRIAAHNTTLREAGFYGQLAPHIDMRSPPCVAIVKDDLCSHCIIILSDLIHEGAHFYSALEPFSLDQVSDSLDQLARLHARSNLIKGRPWIPSRLQELATRESPIPWPVIQAQMLDGRGAGLPESTLDAKSLQASISALAQRNKALPKTLLHGDCHPGNIYCIADNEMAFTDWQLIQKGHWSLDVAYHIAASLPVELAEREEQTLLKHYLEALKRYGGEAEGFEQAWEHYRCALLYGYYHWAITARVAPAITRETFYRVGAAVTRCESYTLLSV